MSEMDWDKWFSDPSETFTVDSQGKIQLKNIDTWVMEPIDDGFPSYSGKPKDGDTQVTTPVTQSPSAHDLLALMSYDELERLRVSGEKPRLIIDPSSVKK